MIYLASDHTGIELKKKIKNYIVSLGYEVEDCGAESFDPLDDYPDFISKAALKVSEDPGNNRAVVMGGSGQGEAMVANKYKGVRCALFYTPVVAQGVIDASGAQSQDPFEILKLSRAHNNSNVLSLGVRFLKGEDALQAVKIWLEAPFPGDERHLRRIKKISEIEGA